MKFFQLLMVCAIFNPFCCCTAGVLTAGETESTPVKHSCCQSQTEDLPANTSDNHDPDACPHKALKEYQANAIKDATSTSDITYTLPALLAAIDFLVFEPVAEIQRPISLATVSHAPPQSLAQVYCVYRI